MAIAGPTTLSSNWLKLKKTLKAKRPETDSPVGKAGAGRDVETGKQLSPKRKRPVGEGASNDPQSLSAKSPSRHNLSRKRHRMDLEGRSMSAKHKDMQALSRSISMPSLRASGAADKSKQMTEPALGSSSDFPDIENEGVSPKVIPAKYIAIDCEMVGTGPEPDRDSALARVSVVDYHGHQVYDSYVQVKVPVTDYRSTISGVEPKHLRRDYARPFKEVQKDIEVLLQGRILIGHAVKNDLQALILKHDPRLIRDTSKYSRFRQHALTPGRTPSLRHLAEKLLGIEIQAGAHSSVEDARATMALFRLEKDGFEAEVKAKYGQVRVQAPSAGRETGNIAQPGGAGKSEKKKKKKKKR